MTRPAADRNVFRHLLAGQQTGGADIPLDDPATATTFGWASGATEADLDRAIDSARSAFDAWRASPLPMRRELLLRIADRIRDNTEALAELLTTEQGKPLAEARGEVAGCESLLRYYAGLRPDDVELFREEAATHVRTASPLGIVAGIVPWNFPLMIATMKIAPAVLAGNVIIVKPSGTTLAATLELGRLITDIVPAGVIQILGDRGWLGAALAAHPDVRKVSLTGSTETGKKVFAAAAPTLKRLTLELGGNDPAIVLDDAVAERIAPGLLDGAFGNAGQICGAIKRLYLHADVYDDVVAELARLMHERLVVGSGLDPRTTVGPMQNARHFAEVTELAARAEADGTVLATVPIPEGNGYFVAPMLVGDLDDSHPLVREEQFAPILPVLRFTDVDEVVRRANATPFGLTASVWTSDVARGERLAHRLEAGLLCVNAHNKGSFDLGIPMSKQSGQGWLFGEESLREYLQPHLLYRVPPEEA